MSLCSDDEFDSGWSSRVNISSLGCFLVLVLVFRDRHVLCRTLGGNVNSLGALPEG